MDLERKIADALQQAAADSQARPGAWSDVQSRIARSRKWRVVGTALAAVVAITGAAVALPRVGREAPPFGSGDGYYIAMPDKVESSSDTGNGGAKVPMTTNLPEGTVANIESQSIDPSTNGYFAPATVSQGRLDVEISGDCVMPPEVQSRRFTIKVIVTQRGQPPNVYNELGPNFEHLEGDQVTTYNGMRALVAEGEYEWPPDKCDKVLNTYQLPDVCKPTGMSINDDEGGANLKAVAGSVVVTLTQLRLCELYDYGTASFKAANPWPVFRDRTTSWIDAHRPLAKSGSEYLLDPQITSMSSKRLGREFNSPAWIEVDYVLRGEKVAHARFVASIWHGGYTKWEIADLQLL